MFHNHTARTKKYMFYRRGLFLNSFHFFHGAQLARMVNPLMNRHASFENFLGRLNTFLFEVLTHFLLVGPAF